MLEFVIAILVSYVSASKLSLTFFII